MVYAYTKDKWMKYNVTFNDEICFQCVHVDKVTCIGDVANIDSKNEIKYKLRRSSMYQILIKSLCVRLLMVILIFKSNCNNFWKDSKLATMSVVKKLTNICFIYNLNCWTWLILTGKWSLVTLSVLNRNSVYNFLF